MYGWRDGLRRERGACTIVVYGGVVEGVQCLIRSVDEM